MNFIKKLFLKKEIQNFYKYVYGNLYDKARYDFGHDFLMKLDEKLYPEYLKYVYEMKMGSKLNLENPVTFTEKIQWLKLYDNTPIKTELTDKFLVRDWIKEKIGEEYLKPVFQICDSFDEIDFDKLPESFIIKCNHGCKYQFIIKNKTKFLNKSVLFNGIKKQIDYWMSKSFFGFSDFELQYKNIKPKILVEQLLRDNIDELPVEYEVYCFNGVVKIIDRHKGNDQNSVTIWDENFNNINLRFAGVINLIKDTPDDLAKLAVSLSEKLSKQFKFVRVDFLVYNNRIYFNEVTFTPRSGFIFFPEDSKEWNLKLGNFLNLEAK